MLPLPNFLFLQQFFKAEDAFCNNGITATKKQLTTNKNLKLTSNYVQNTKKQEEIHFYLRKPAETLPAGFSGLPKPEGLPIGQSPGLPSPHTFDNLRLS